MRSLSAKTSLSENKNEFSADKTSENPRHEYTICTVGTQLELHNRAEGVYGGQHDGVDNTSVKHDLFELF